MFRGANCASVERSRVATRTDMFVQLRVSLNGRPELKRQCWRYVGYRKRPAINWCKAQRAQDFRAEGCSRERGAGLL